MTYCYLQLFSTSQHKNRHMTMAFTSYLLSNFVYYGV